VKQPLKFYQHLPQERKEFKNEIWSWHEYRSYLEEVGLQFSVTRERIRQIEAKALRKLKHPSRSKQLKSFLES